MKRFWIALLSVCLLLTLCAGCAETPADDASNAASEAVSDAAGDAESTNDATPDKPEGDADAESSEEGGLLLGTTTGSEATTTEGSVANTTTKKNDTTKKGDKTTSKVTIATHASTTKPAGAVTIASTTTKQEIVLPRYDIDFTKSVKVCIDWDPKSSWVQTWEKAFHACYDPDKEIEIKYVQASPSAKASKLAVWKSAKQMPDAIYIKIEESWPDLVVKGFAKPIDDMVDLSAGFWEGVIGTMNTLKVNNKHYALVTDIGAGGSVIYNPKVFKNAGLTDPRDLVYKNEWTFTKFEEYAKKLTKVNATNPTKNTYGCYFHYWEAFWQCGGVDLVKYDNGKWVSNMNDKSIIDILEYLRKLGPAGNKYAYSEGNDMTAIRNMAISGQIGMFITRESPSLEFTNDEFNKGLLQFVPIPRYDKSDVWYAGGTCSGFYVLSGSKNPEGGIAYATGVRALNVMNLDVDAASDTEYPQDQKYLQEYADSVQVAVPQPFRRLEGTIMYWDLWGPVIRGEQSWSAVVAEWEPQVLEALNKG